MRVSFQAFLSFTKGNFVKKISSSSCISSLNLCKKLNCLGPSDPKCYKRRVEAPFLNEKERKEEDEEEEHFL